MVRWAGHGSELGTRVSMQAGIVMVVPCIDIHEVAMLSCGIVIPTVVGIVGPRQVNTCVA